ncbi:MAG: TonB-dependent receptor [Pseudomonadota bacterium]
MRRSRESKCALILGVSAIALGGGGAVHAQEDETRTMATVTVTTQKTEESIQDVPIAVSAFDESALEKLQLAGGPDLVKSIPNVAFTKGNFTAFNFKIRGIGADLIAQSGDAGVGVHQNDVPLQANRLFEAEFFDVERVETLRGPQGTLYGRNATGGVINVITAKPTIGEFEANARLTYGNFNTVKGKGMINLPLGDTAALRLAGSYLTRDGFADNSVTGNTIDGRELYGIRGTFAWEPTEFLRTWVMVEHFEEDDDRIRSGKQLCIKDPFRTEFGGIPISPADQLYTSLGCQAGPLSESNDRVNSAATLGGGLAITAGLLNGDAFTDPINPDLRTIESAFDPIYQADQTLIEWKAEFDIGENLTATYLGSHSESSILSIEDYNKTAPNITFNETGVPLGNPALAPLYQALFPGGVVNDPQLGAANLFRSFDLSGGDSEQFTHELRLQSSFDGRFNFNVGGIVLDFETIDPQNNTDGYYVFSNSLTALTQLNNALGGAIFGGNVPLDPGELFSLELTGAGGNYFRSISPFSLESVAVFGEGYFDVTDTVQLTVGLRYTDDEKKQDIIPTILFTPLPEGADPFATQGVQQEDFQETTGRVVLDWSPDLAFSDDSLFFASFSRGYKGGGINPPQPAGAELFPTAFDPEFINAYEIGTKNTLGDGRLQANATGFFYDYEGYQIAQIINRTSANFNIDAEIRGFEFESIWNPASTLLLTANLGLLDTKVLNTEAIDVLDRTNGDPNFVVIKNASSFANCVVSAQAYGTILGAIAVGALPPGSTAGLCTGAFVGAEADFGLPAGAFTPSDGFAVDVSGNEIPNAPDMTLSLGAEYTFEGVLSPDWNLTVRGDYYYQSNSFSRIWNTARDRLESWDNLNLTVQLFNDDLGLSIEAFGKNILDEDVITGAYLTDDSSGLFTNIFLNEPATYGITVAKRW